MTSLSFAAVSTFSTFNNSDSELRSSTQNKASTYNFHKKSGLSGEPPNLENPVLSQVVFESWVDGLLILTEQREWVQANESARRICQRLRPEHAQAGSVPEPIWQACLTLIQSCRSHPQQTMTIESEVVIDGSAILRIRARWFCSNQTKRPYLLVILEDRDQSSQRLAIAEVDRYGLTAREADVWLLYRSNYTYKEIAAKLFISINTVKKHMKSIHAKRQDTLELEE